METTFHGTSGHQGVNIEIPVTMRVFCDNLFGENLNSESNRDWTVLELGGREGSEKLESSIVGELKAELSNYKKSPLSGVPGHNLSDTSWITRYVIDFEKYAENFQKQSEKSYVSVFGPVKQAPNPEWAKSFKKMVSDNAKFEVIHQIDRVPENPIRYCGEHTHDDFEEYNVLLGFNGSQLVYDVVIGSERYLLKSPAITRIPKGVPHSQNAVSGSGYFIAMVDSHEYYQGSKKQKQ